VRAATILATAIVTAAIATGSVSGAPKAGARIAFTYNKAIYVIGADGSGLRRITHDKASDGGIAWSNDGKLLAFGRYFGNNDCGEDQSRGDLYLIGADGKGERRVTTTACMYATPRNPVFAPKGRTLAFTDDEGVLLAKATAWKPRRVSDFGLFPSWAPDARRLVVARGSDLEILDTVTGAKRKVATGDFAVWSHKGNSLAYVSGKSLLLIHPPGGPIRRLATASENSTFDNIAWSPGDDRIAYSTSTADLKSTSWVVTVAGGKLLKLGAGAFPAWDPDGTMLSLEVGNFNYLYLVRADGSGRHRLTKGFGAAWAPVP
jgi:Tol biopolymer transport system component